MIHYIWRKLSAAKWEDVWLERLTPVGDRVAITAFAGKKTIRIEAFQLTRAQADELVATFGGEVLEQKREIALQPRARAPIRVREKLIIASSETERDALVKEYPERKIILIPAGMAFGTGDHATTSTCLRLLSDASDQLRDWEMLDLGCGTAILAIAARLLGAKKAEAGDFDPDAVRVSKENVRANQVSKLSVRKLDVRQWTPERTWDVVVANMFSGILIEVAAKIVAATAPGGRLIFSGILRDQEKAVVEAFEANGFRIDQIVRKGKWITGAATRI
ncbi:MAG: ribosomal protein methyltransferase [Chthoniobacteraceae bacterium]|nr:ribosomal protein methyltransferase [Chthoniobacteraceae bacterium]